MTAGHRISPANLCGWFGTKFHNSDVPEGVNQGALAGETKWCVFQIPCEMQRGLDLLHSNYMKERSKREQGHRLQSRRFR